MSPPRASAGSTSLPVTPSKPQLQPKAGATPRVNRPTSDGLSITKIRTDITEEMAKEMVQCSLDEFQNSYFNCIPYQEDIDACMVELKFKGILNNKNELAEDFRPTKSAYKENAAFRFIDDFADVILKRHPNEVPIVKYKECPDDVVISEIPGSTFKIDGCLKLQSNSNISTQEGKVNAPDAAVIFEFKKSRSDTNISDNQKKIVSAASHIMNDDPRRAYMFGITMEGHRMTVWYFSRSHSTVSEVIDYFKEPKKLISTFFSLLFATATDLGYDPAVRRYDTGTKIHYEYRIKSGDTFRYYKTLEALSSYRALGITGRMTRVWKAQEIDDFEGEPTSAKHVALKDVWLDSEAETEREIQEKIFKAIESEDPATKIRFEYFHRGPLSKLQAQIKNKEYRKYFMTIDCDGERTMVTKAKPSNAYHVPFLFKSDDTDSRSSQFSKSSHRGEAPDSRRSTRESVATNNEHRDYVGKKRYLVVYSDVGEALHYTRDLPTVFRALYHAIHALALMFVANWVHRDVSTGNIIVLGGGSSACGKLSDLEYAKEFNSQRPSSSDPKTGTAFFMAYEISSGFSLYTPMRPIPPQEFISQEVEDYSDDETDPFVMPPPSVIPPPSYNSVKVIYNFQHDLESIWWIALWILLYQVDHKPSRDYTTTVYLNRTLPSHERGNVFKVENHLQQQLQTHLHDDLKEFIPILNRSRYDLMSYYQSRQNLLDASSYAPIFHSVVSMAGTGLKASRRVDGLVLMTRARTVPEPSSIDPPIIPTTASVQKRVRSQDASGDNVDGVGAGGRKRRRRDPPAGERRLVKLPD